MKPPSPSRDLPATANVECVSVAGRWRLETGGAADTMQDALFAFGAVGFLVLSLALVLMTALPDPARSWVVCGFVSLVVFWVWRLFQRSRRGSGLLIEADQARVFLGESTWTKAAVKEVRAETWMRQGVPGFKVELVLQDSPLPVVLMQGSGHPLPEEVLRRFCAGCGLRLKIAVVS
ncbi:hypothetical protein [Verrucomicrobium sp. BvORR034]|uniref:hypothetical protein n=1 Tax=Verrucomicrobium sp. BvORR034 TaxID=1396418 RepID=UPI000679559C|nr:hypothetical protein [Verrucomicrobium sp. BvORR034]